MSVDVPLELLSPTVEELEERTARDLAVKWKPCKKLGKKERNEIKREIEAARIKQIASEYGKPRKPSRNSLSALFVQNERREFSLAEVSSQPKQILLPTLKASVEKVSRTEIITSQLPPKSISAVRKRGRPPKVNPL